MLTLRTHSPHQSNYMYRFFKLLNSLKVLKSMQQNARSSRGLETAESENTHQFKDHLCVGEIEDSAGGLLGELPWRQAAGSELS